MLVIKSTVNPVWILVMVVLTAWQPLCAEDSPRWNVSGFGTLATLATDTDQLGFIRDRSQLESTYSNWGISNDSRLGLQLDLAFNDQWNATVQWIARDHAGDFFEQNLEWAFIRERDSFLVGRAMPYLPIKDEQILIKAVMDNKNVLTYVEKKSVGTKPVKILFALE